MSGDFWQLPPTDGCFLGDIPYEYIENYGKHTPAPFISFGQCLLWSDPKEGTGFEGVSELIDCERKQDL